DRPHVMPPRHDEEIEIAFRLEVEMRNAARQRDHADERQRADQPQRGPMPLENRTASRLAEPPLDDEIATAGGKEEAAAIFEHVAESLAAQKRREHVCRGSIAFDERALNLVERHG